MNYRLTNSLETPSNTKKNIAELNEKMVKQQSLRTAEITPVIAGESSATLGNTTTVEEDSESGSDDENRESITSKSTKKAEV